METFHTDLTMSAITTGHSDNATFNKLKCKWNLWAHLPQDPDWTVKSYKKICQFKTVEETIGITESLPADLIKNCMLFIMKDGITPMWEDPEMVDAFRIKCLIKMYLRFGEILRMFL
jgi:hypothetical protein